MDATLSGWALWPAWLVAALVLARTTPGLRRHLADADEKARRILIAATLALAAMRWFNTAALQGVMLHFLGATIATLLFGAGTACWVMALVSLAGLLMGAAWHGWAMDFLATGALPVAVSAVVSWAARTWLPRNVFTYVMLNAFAGAAVAMAASMLAKTAVTAWLGGRALEAYLVATPMLMFAEAFFAGGVMVLVVVYRPHWCRSFDDRAYLWPEQRM
ncbi:MULTISPECIES: energy-coupling factor ABC transporter permease [unclassified Luteimonas]